MPIIEELSDSDDNASPPQPDHLSTQQVSEASAQAALDRCIRILSNESQPIELRYHDISSGIAPVERYLSSAPAPKLSAFEERILTLLRPHPALIPAASFNDDDDAANQHSPELSIYHTLSLNLLTLLQPHSLTPSADLAITLSSLTNPSDAFTTAQVATLATTILSSHLPALSSSDIIITGILTDNIKPLFTQRTVSATRITSAGRLALRESTANLDLPGEAAPWSNTLPGAMAVLEWILSTGLCDGDLETAWPLLIPPILGVNDSHVITLRTRGIGMVTLLLKRLEEAKSDLLQRTGLGGVLWEAVERGLGYFPPLTPTRESVGVNKKATECLRLLVRVREPKDVAKRAGLLDQIVREGFVKGMVYAGEKIEVVETLIEGLEAVVNDLGIWAVRHLQTVLPSLSEILGNPFATTYSPLLRRTLHTEQAIIRNCWPRISAHVPEILHGITECWSQILEDEQVPGTGQTKVGELNAIKAELRKTVAMLKAVFEAPGEGQAATGRGRERWEKIQRDVIEVDAGFESLFEYP